MLLIYIAHVHTPRVFIVIIGFFSAARIIVISHKVTRSFLGLCRPLNFSQPPTIITIIVFINNRCPSMVAPHSTTPSASCLPCPNPSLSPGGGDRVFPSIDVARRTYACVTVAPSDTRSGYRPAAVVSSEDGAHPLAGLEGTLRRRRARVPWSRTPGRRVACVRRRSAREN